MAYVSYVFDTVGPSSPKASNASQQLEQSCVDMSGSVTPASGLRINVFILVLQMELVYHDGKVHSLMDGAVVVERPAGGERPNGVRVVAIELEVVHHWSVRLSP